MTMKVPTGAWQRDWIQRHGGALDRAITVRYVQTPSVFGDLRIPADLPGRPALSGAASFAELDDDQLAALATQNGFAGVTTIDGASATWHHEIDYQPAGGGADLGRIEPVSDGKMFEHGPDGAYVESWSVLEPDVGPYFAARIAQGGRASQLLAVAGGHFVHARARQVPLPPGDSLGDAIARTHATREMIIAYLDCEISYGSVRDWQIELSTLPWLQGKRLAFADRIAVDASGQPVPRTASFPASGPAPLDEAWSFPVNTFSPAALRALFAAR
jgi:hypothetical protein